MSGRRGETQTPSLILFYSFTILLVFLDQFTKFLVLQGIPLHGSLPVIPGIFHLTLVFNQGIAFGLFRDHESLLFLLITASLGLLLWVSRHIPRWPSWSRWAFALITGGAIGNWIDRVRLGYVVDFFDLRVWPVFNVADSAITVGVSLYVIMLFRGSPTPSGRRPGGKKGI